MYYKICYTCGTVFIIIISLVAGSRNIISTVAVTTSYQAVEGTNISISCNATETPGVTIQWSKDDSSPVRWLHSGPTLKLIGISRNDTGNYTCWNIDKTDPSQNRYVEKIELNVLYPAKITKFEVQPSLTAENQTFTITCMIEGNPSPTWEIRHNRTHDVVYSSHDQGGVVMTVPAKCGDDGAYVCTGYNDLNHDENVTEGQAVDVNCSPRLDPKRNHTLVRNVMLGRRILYIIIVIGFPVPTYSWSRDNDEPMGNVTEISRSRGAALRFNHIQISDFGNYTLVMNNTFGSSSVDFALRPHPLDSPQPPTNLTFNNVTSDSVILNWISGYDMGGNMSFVVNQQTLWGWTRIRQLYEPYTDHGAGQSLSYNLTGLVENTNYTLVLAAIKTVILLQLYEPYTGNGTGQSMCYNLTGLDENTNYTLALTATKTGMVLPSSSSNSISFSTKVGYHHPQSPQNDQLSTAAIILIAIGTATVAYVFVAVAVIILLRRRRGSHKRPY